MSKSALIIVDMQNDFLSGGPLEVHGSDAIIDQIVAASDKFDVICATADLHPIDHESFTAWPAHCVTGTTGAELHDKIKRLTRIVFPKGTYRDLDSYSGFYNHKKAATGLDRFLKQEKIKKVFICGVAVEYCVKHTALDARALGYETYILRDLCRGMNLDESSVALRDLEYSGVHVLNSDALAKRMNFDRFESIIDKITFPNMVFRTGTLGEGYFVQVQSIAACDAIGADKDWRGRKWYLSAYSTKSEVVQTCLKAVITFLEHEARESFKYKGQAVFRPHFDVEELCAFAACAKPEIRSNT